MDKVIKTTLPHVIKGGYQKVKVKLIVEYFYESDISEMYVNYHINLSGEGSYPRRIS